MDVAHAAPADDRAQLVAAREIAHTAIYPDWRRP
jgi:hypothetical protein